VYYFIEPMVEDDIEAVQRVERESFHTGWSPHTYRRELRQPMSSRYIVARASQNPPPKPQQGNRSARRKNGLFKFLAPFLDTNPPPMPHPLVGYAGVWLNFDEAHVTTIAVARSQRGRSIGELLLNGLIDEALDMGASRLTLEVRVSNSVAQNLYLKYGFYPMGKRKRYYTDNNEDALIMWTDAMNSIDYQARLRELRQDLFARLRAQTRMHLPESPGDESSIAYLS
jgi:ribosomal-protein-alanine N-acetyltransferase